MPPLLPPVPPLLPPVHPGHEWKAGDKPRPSSELAFPAFSILQGTPIYHSLIPAKE